MERSWLSNLIDSLWGMPPWGARAFWMKIFHVEEILLLLGKWRSSIENFLLGKFFSLGGVWYLWMKIPYRGTFAPIGRYMSLTDGFSSRGSGMVLYDHKILGSPSAWLVLNGFSACLALAPFSFFYRPYNMTQLDTSAWMFIRRCEAELKIVYCCQTLKYWE